MVKYGTLEYKELSVNVNRVRYTEGQADFQEHEVTKGQWRVVGHQAALMLARVVPSSSHPDFGVTAVEDNISNVEHIRWLMQRYPLEIKTERWGQRLRELEDQERKRSGMESLEKRELVGSCFTGVLRDFQKEGLDFLLKSSGVALLADEMGLGKGVQALSYVTSEKDAFPVLVVAPLITLQNWRREIFKFTRKEDGSQPIVRLIRDGKAHDLHPADYYIINYELLVKRIEDIERAGIKTIVADEVQNLRNQGTQKYRALKELGSFQSVKHRIGLSVGPETRIILRGGPFSAGWTGSIEDAWRMVIAAGASARTEGGYEIASVSALGIQTRGWIGEGFGWKAVKSFIGHALGDVGFREIRFGGERFLRATDSHSIFVASENRNELQIASAAEIEVGDIVPMDDGAGWDVGVPEVPLRMLAIASGLSKAKVQVDLEPIGSPLSPGQRQKLGISIWDWNNFRRQGTFGTYLPLQTYADNEKDLPEARRVYLGKSMRPNWFPPELYLSKLAYLMGFWLGDGWLSGTRVCFAVDNPRLAHFLAYLDEVGTAEFGNSYTVRATKGKSSEVRCGNVLLARAIENAIGGTRHAWDKEIPGEWITSWSRQARMELLQGLIDSDGHQSKRQKRLYYTTVSKSLAYSLVDLLTSLGVKASISTRRAEKGGIVRGIQINGKHLTYVVNWSWYAMNGINKGRFGARRSLDWSEGHFIEATVKSIASVTLDSRPEIVYDLEVEGHPSFSANGALAHNSGTPCYNHGSEIWSIVDFLYPGLLGDYAGFCKEYVYDFTGEVMEAKREALYQVLIQNIMLRRRKADVLKELPAKTRYRQKIEVDLKYYEEEMRNLVQRIQSQIGQNRTSLTLIHQQQNALAAGERQIAGVAKVPWVVEFVEEMMSLEEPIVVFVHHLVVHQLLREKLAKYYPASIIGGQSDEQRQSAIDEFQNGGTKLLIAGLRAGNLGINLTAASYVIFGELDWSPAIHRQAEDRLHRIGQDSPVFAYYLEGTNTYDEHLAELLVDKKLELDSILGDAPEVSQNMDERTADLLTFVKRKMGQTLDGITLEAKTTIIAEREREEEIKKESDAAQSPDGSPSAV